MLGDPVWVFWGIFEGSQLWEAFSGKESHPIPEISDTWDLGCTLPVTVGRDVDNRPEIPAKLTVIIHCI